jgi:hypothetical protein
MSILSSAKPLSDNANGLWNLLGTCEIWHIISPTGLWQFFQLVLLLFLRNFDLVFRDLSRPLRLVKKMCCIAIFFPWILYRTFFCHLSFVCRCRSFQFFPGDRPLDIS